MKAEFSEPTPEEYASPIEIIEDAQIAGSDRLPGAATGTIIKAVVAVQIIDGVEGSVTIRGPEGNYLTIPVEDPALIAELNVGEVVILTYGEAFALTLERVEK